MTPALFRLIGYFLGLALTTSVAATEIYRCGPAGATYSQTPCAEGRRIDTLDTRDDEQRLQATQVHERTSALASTLERDRRTYEATHPPPGAAGFNMPKRKTDSKTAASHTKLSKAQAQRLRQAQAARRRASQPPATPPVQPSARD